MDIGVLKAALLANSQIASLPSPSVVIKEAKIEVLVNGQYFVRNIDDATLSQTSGAGNEAAWVTANAPSIYNQLKTTMGNTS